jgi:AraC-like DNA-binding protein
MANSSARPDAKQSLLQDDVDLIPFSEQVEQRLVPASNDYMIERHEPGFFHTPYHHHTSVEVNFLQNCEMSYSFSGSETTLKPERITVFWGAAPHRVAGVNGKGQITNIYLSLGQFVRWGLPQDFVDAILTGSIICAKSESRYDPMWFDRLFEERGHKSIAWRRTHLDEIELRLRRLALEGWNTLLKVPGHALQDEITSQAMLYVEAMLRHIADNFTIPITVQEIAEAANLSASRGSALFRKVMGVSVKQHLMRARLSHARMLLTETDAKVASIALDSGFPTLSAFYDAFTKANGLTPAEYRKSANRSNPFIAEHSRI